MFTWRSPSPRSRYEKHRAGIGGTRAAQMGSRFGPLVPGETPTEAATISETLLLGVS
jgi:hypothetical protein